MTPRRNSIIQIHRSKEKHNQGPQEKNMFSSDLYGKTQLTWLLVLPGCFSARVKQHPPRSGCRNGVCVRNEGRGGHPATGTSGYLRGPAARAVPEGLVGRGGRGAP